MADEMASLLKSIDGRLAKLEKNAVGKEDIRQIVGEELSTRGLATNEALARLRQQTREDIQEAVDAVLKGVDGLHSHHEKRFNKVDNELASIRNNIANLKHDTPTRRAFNELKERVDKYHPIN